MKRFVELFEALDATTRTTEKVRALEDYFRTTPAADAAWALWFLSGGRQKRLVKAARLRAWAAELAALPEWLVEECYDAVGDLAETLALLLPLADARSEPPTLGRLVAEQLLPLGDATEEQQRESLRRTWGELSTPQRFVWNKMITGGFRVGVSRALLVRALASVAAVPPPVMAHRLIGTWQPTAKDFTRLLASEGGADDAARPYPFYLASPLAEDLASLGAATDWQCEWKWDGIRAQVLRRAGTVVVWSRGEELITEAFPEIAAAARFLPEGTVLDGELLAWQGEGPAPFARLQRRLNRVNPTAAQLREIPVVLVAFDLLERNGVDLREQPLATRRVALAEVLATAAHTAAQAATIPPPPRAWIQADLFGERASTDASERPNAAPSFPLRLAPVLDVVEWEEVVRRRSTARERGTEGVMLKRRDSPYGVGRPRGAWWKWKVDPFTCDAVLVAAQPGHGRRASLFTDYTFAVWRGDELVPVAKAYSGLSDAEIQEVDAFVRSHTTGRFGPVRSVAPEWVFELAFDGLAESTRHRAGLALRFPRMLRRRTDKRPAEADTVDTLRALARGGFGAAPTAGG